MRYALGGFGLGGGAAVVGLTRALGWMTGGVDAAMVYAWSAIGAAGIALCACGLCRLLMAVPTPPTEPDPAPECVSRGTRPSAASRTTRNSAPDRDGRG